ncbi:DUF4331 family protein [Sphingomonas sp.]|uniref:DUF4331 family protein n=1 Tax=Sphingomonas sp. TaxID=28214 RepID=UPI0025CCB883|nr:DUF4331 family protein [Sphingomonas sp.]
MNRPFIIAAPLVALVALSACGNDAPTATVPTPMQTPASYEVSKCLSQEVAPGVTVASLVIPDTLSINFAAPAGFPNGRKLADPVIDIELAVLLLDLKKHNPGTLALLPLNPAANDLPFRPDFPYLAAPQGTPPIPAPAGTNFDFRSDPTTAYVRVDRMGQPAVATVLVHAGNKTAFNDDSPADDAPGKWGGEFTGSLVDLQNELVDDLKAANLTTCATPKT